MNYDNQIINNVCVSDVLNSKEEKIHKILFENALNKLKANYSYYTDENYSFIEYRVSTDYLQPSKVLIISKRYPYTKKTIDLSDYWDTYKFNKEYDKIDNTDESLEIIELLYTSGKALIKNKYTGEEFTLDFKQCKNIPYSEDWYRFSGEINSKSSVNTNFNTNI